MTPLVRDFLQKKEESKKFEQAVISIGPNDSSIDALKVLADLNIGAIVVLDGDKFIGMFTEREFTKQCILKGNVVANCKVKDVMQRELYAAKKDDKIIDCLNIMSEKQVKHMAVVEDDTVIGVISLTDVVNCIMTKQDFIIDEMNKYVYGGRM